MENSSRYQDLIRKILYEDWARPNRDARGIAVVSAHPGAGVSYICAAIRDGIAEMAVHSNVPHMELVASAAGDNAAMHAHHARFPEAMAGAMNNTRDTRDSVSASQSAVIVDVRKLNQPGEHFGSVLMQSLESNLLRRLTQDGISVRTKLHELAATWQDRPSCRKECLKTIANIFRLVLLDVPSLRESSDIRGVAPLVEGVIVVVDAGRTTSKQISHLTRTIDDAGGRVLGYVLNKRTYPIPEAIYQRLDMAGLT